MAKITLEGNVGKVETGEAGGNQYISFNLAENFSYFDRQKEEWIDKGTQWHDCVMFIRKDNQSRFERYLKFISVGAGLLITGRTSVNPSDEKDSSGKPKYLNPYINVDEIGLLTTRLESVAYKPKTTVGNMANDPELQQQTQQQEQAPAPVAQQPQAAATQQPTATVDDDPFPNDF